MDRNKLGILISILIAVFVITGCSSQGEQADAAKENNADGEATASKEEVAEDEKSEDNKKDNEKTLTGSLELSETEGRIGDKVELKASGLRAEEDLTVVYVDYEGVYDIDDDNYSFLGTMFDRVEKEVSTGTADEDGNWEGTITIPEGFGDDHDIIIYQNDDPIAKANFFVRTVFRMEPESGPIGTEIEIIGEGLSYQMFGSIWHVNYDNNYTGMITAVTTNGEARAVIRAVGEVGPHTITVEDGPFGAPFLSRSDSAINYIHTQYFTFTVTDDEPVNPEDLVYVEEPPKPAGGGIELPEPENKSGVEISISKEEGIVDEEVELTGTGLESNVDVTFDWHTMVGTRVTAEGFSPEVFDLGTTKTDDDGNFTYAFNVPEDLGGLPHLIDVKVDDEIVGQSYLRILPSVTMEPTEGPPGTEINIKIKGSGWTEYDNALAVTYDNSRIGYVCGFFTQGTVTVPLIASGNTGYHAIDIYPSIYQGNMVKPDIYTKPQLTYREDHPGTGIPAIRTFFKVTEE